MHHLHDLMFEESKNESNSGSKDFDMQWNNLLNQANSNVSDTIPIS